MLVRALVCLRRVVPPTASEVTLSRTFLQAAEGNLLLAWLLVVGAGLATAVGAAFAFFAKITDHRLLACALGISAGVMT